MVALDRCPMTSLVLVEVVVVGDHHRRLLEDLASEVLAVEVYCYALEAAGERLAQRGCYVAAMAALRA